MIGFLARVIEVARLQRKIVIEEVNEGVGLQSKKVR